MCSSDLLQTEAGQNSEFAQRIYTVVPVYTEKRDSKNPGVVYQFAYLTLDRALQCKGSRGRAAFWKCWSDTSLNQDYLEEEIRSVDAEFSADGDSHVSLRLIGYRDW